MRTKNAKAEVFLQELEQVFRKHGLSLSHEDGQGAFLIEPFSEANLAWLKQASIEGVEQEADDHAH